MSRFTIALLGFFFLSCTYSNNKNDQEEIVNANEGNRNDQDLSKESANFDFLQNVKSYDLSKLWSDDSIFIEGTEDKIPFPEPIGFIGEDYQRFYIHYTSVIKSKDNPFEYRVTGKTRVKNNICNFKGTITVQKAELDKSSVEPEFSRYKKGILTCLISFYEDSTQNSSGFIKGKLSTNFFIDQNDKIYYDALIFVSDGFSNNEVKGNWTSYKTGKSKKCNWGDFRIPDSGALDIGAGEFSVNPRFLNNGWVNYQKANSGNPETLESKKANEDEVNWWK